MGNITNRVAGATTSLQGVYERSIPPEILINDSLGAVVFGVGSTASNTDNVVEFQNKSGTLKGFIRGDGLASFTSIIYDPADPVTWTSLTGSAPDDVFEALDALLSGLANSGFIRQDATNLAIYSNNLPVGVAPADLGDDAVDIQSVRANLTDYVSGKDSTAVGQNNRITLDNSIALGNNIQIQGSSGFVTVTTAGSNIDVDITHTASTPDYVVIGKDMSVTMSGGSGPVSNCIFMGSNMEVTGGFISNSIFIGKDLTINGILDSNAIHIANGGASGNIENSVFVGRMSAVNQRAVGIGRTAKCGIRSIAIGYGADANADNSLALGYNADVNGYERSVALGRSASCTANNQCVLGSTGTYELNLLVTGNDSATSTTTGSGVFAGGVGIAKQLYVGDLTGTAVNLLGADANGKIIETSISATTILGKYVADIGDNSTNPITVNHALNTTDITVTIYENSSGDIQYPTVTVVDADNISVSFDSTPSLDEYRAIVIG